MIALLLQAAAAATLTGDVRERGSGDPVAGVVIATDGATLGTTDARGAFHVEAEPGARLDFTHDDYEVLAIVVDGTDVRVFLTPTEAPIEIVVESFKATSAVSRHVIDAEIAYETPGSLDDAVRLVQSLPSVAIQREYSPSAGDLSVRGSSAGDSRYYLDGVELPYLYHYNQYASVYPTAWLDHLELYPSTFGANYGDSVGGIVDAVSVSEAPEKLHGSVSWNLLMGGADVRFPLGKGWWTSVAARRSYLDFVSGTSAQYTLWPVFSDHAARVQKDLTDGDVGVFAIGATDAWDRAAGELDLLDPVEASVSPGFEYRRGYEVLGVARRWDGQDGALEGRWVGGGVYDSRRGDLTVGGAERLRTTYLTSRLDLGRAPVEHLGWGAGYELRGELADYRVADPGPQGILVAEEAPGLGRGVAIDDTLPRVRGAAYGEGRLRWGGLRVFPGLRVGGDSGVPAFLVDPRLAVRWRVADQTELLAAGGGYHQTPESDLVMDPRYTPTVTRAWEAEIGLQQTFANRLELVMSGWTKSLTNLTVAPVGAAPYVVPTALGLGGEAVVRYRMRERFFWWGWLGLQRTVAQDGDRQLPVDGDQPLTTGMVASWDVSRRVNLGLRVRYGSGLPYTNPSGSIYDATHDAWLPVLDDDNGARLPPFAKVDAHFAYTIPFRRWTLQTALEAGVVPPAYAALYPTWSYDYREQGYVKGPVFLPLVSLRATF